MTQQPDWKEVGHIGDVNWPEYSGGPVSVDKTGVYPPELEYVEPPEDADEPGATWTVYRVILDPEVPNWGNIKQVAESAGVEVEDLEADFESDDPVKRAFAYETWAGHYGWNEFDQYPLTLTRLEVEKLYDTDLGGKSGIVDALEEEAQRMADESSAQAWSTPGDQMTDDLEAEGYDPKSIVDIAEFGDAVAVNGDITDKTVHGVESELEAEGYELTDKGGRIPAEEGMAWGEHVLDAVAKRLKMPTKDIAAVAESLDWWQEEIPRSTSGDGSVWAKKKVGVEERHNPVGVYQRSLSERRDYYEIKSTDVNKALIHAFGRSWSVTSFIGQIMPQDVGKRVYLVAPGVLQVENDQQRAKRLAGVREIRPFGRRR